MTTARVDPVLGLVYPVVLTFGDQPPQEIGVVQANNGAEQALVDLVGLLHDAADVMLVGGDEAIAQARHRYAQLLTQDTRSAQSAVDAGTYVPGSYAAPPGCRRGRGRSPAGSRGARRPGDRLDGDHVRPSALDPRGPPRRLRGLQPASARRPPLEL